MAGWPAHERLGVLSALTSQVAYATILPPSLLTSKGRPYAMRCASLDAIAREGSHEWLTREVKAYSAEAQKGPPLPGAPLLAELAPFALLLSPNWLQLNRIKT